jgi:xanthine dehydrogenase YagS FAD-binding subunit
MRSETRKFGLLTPTSVSDAVSLLTKYGGQAKVMAGGTDLLYQIKENIAGLVPQYVVDITGLGLDDISYDSTNGLTVGAAANVSAVLANSAVQTSYGALYGAVAGHAVQIANQATIGGDLMQEVWCWYLRNNFDCWRNGGNVCYGAGGDNRYYHTIFGGNLCYAVHAGDIATALFALDADVTIQGPGGSRTASMDQFMPGITVVDGRIKENSLRFNEILTQVHIPAPAPNSASFFYKCSDRNAIDFALASCAVNVTFNGTSVSSAKVVLGGVAEKPIRATAAESFLAGQQLNEANIATAATKALSGATPLTEGTGNAFRVYIAQGVVKKALRSLPNSS